MEALLELGGWEGAAAVTQSSSKDPKSQRRIKESVERRGGRVKNGSDERLRRGGQLDGLQRWR